MDRWLYIRHAAVIDKIIEIGPDTPFTSGSVELEKTRGHVLVDLKNHGSVTWTGRQKKTNTNIYKVSRHQYNQMKKIQEQFKNATS
ncbi:hypothetical protein [Bacteroides sp.]|uniref:hypothetical protein n=1 Tax=Bacteroides sp. TaxID=29523 RepID=UPI002618AF91|nr:hypothetical protein [Bacteroides sp.]MDD3040581.1 hypothetical protein [Bacteroides sp.]